MNKFLLTIFIAMQAVIVTACEKETILPEDKIPSEIKTYVAAHFPTHTIIQSVQDKDGSKLTYEIKLSDGISLEFNSKKEIIEIDGQSKLPDSVIPEKILLYVTTNHPQNFITDWEITDRNNQQVELNNGLEVLFNPSGEFLRLDN